MFILFVALFHYGLQNVFLRLCNVLPIKTSKFPNNYAVPYLAGGGQLFAPLKNGSGEGRDQKQNLGKVAIPMNKSGTGPSRQFS